MKIHHIVNDIDLEKGGAQRIVRYLHNGLLEKGVDSTVLTIGGQSEDLENLFPLANPSVYSFSAFFSVFNYIRNHCKKDEIIHVHLFPSLLYVALAVRVLGWKGKIVCTEHNTNNRRRGTFLGKIIDQMIYPIYERIYCISEGTKTALGSWMPSQNSKLEVIENGTILKNRVLNLKSCSDDRIIFISAGRLHKQKNYSTILRALSLLKEINFEYRIAGVGEELSSLQNLCEELDIREKVIFCGYISDIFSFLQEGDIFLICSLWEGFGLAVVEAMNVGLPVVASNVSGLREILDTPNACGVLVSPEDPVGIAQGIRSLLEVEIRLKLGKNAFQRSLDFSQEKMVAKYFDAYKRLYN